VKKSLGRRVATTLFSVVALFFAAGLIIATSVPSSLFAQAASATSTSKSASASVKAATHKTTYTDEEGQTMTVAVGTDTSVSRDGFAATSVEAYGQIEDLAESAGYRVDNTGSIQWPFNTPVPLGDPFGPRVAPCAGCSTFHNGTDFETGDKANVYSVAAGTVTQSGVNGDLGYAVTIQHDVNGYVFETVYGHMTAGSLKVNVGDTVTKGELVGLTGSTGMSTGPHLFFEVDIDGKPIDSFKWLKKHTAS
jgi:murein DD-endopeptidase MepM/ murein hydrolase activator NlpD